MEISDCTVARDILLEIGYYRLRGYSFHLYNHDTKQYKPGTSLEGHSKIGYVDLMDSYHCSPTKYVCP